MRFSLLAPVSSAAQASAAIAAAGNTNARAFWSTQGEAVDALTALAVGAGDTSLDLGTAVIPIQGRHPMVLAQQALTVNEHLEGQLILGLGVSHRPFVETTWGMSYATPVAQMAEYLDVLEPLLDRQEVDHAGQRWTMRGHITTTGDRPRLYLSALGPRMAQLAGARADGIITWFVGPRSLETITVPAIDRGASAADRLRPELVAGFPVCVTSTPDEARRLANSQYGGLAALPTYRTTLEREGCDAPADLALIGTAAEVHDRVLDLERLGVTNLMADVFGSPDEKAATYEMLDGLTSVIDIREQESARMNQ